MLSQPHQELHRLADVSQLLPCVPCEVLGLDKPVLQLRQARLDVLTVAEGAALAAQEERVEQLDVDEAEDLGEELAHEKHRHVIGLPGLGFRV